MTDSRADFNQALAHAEQLRDTAAAAEARDGVEDAHDERQAANDALAYAETLRPAADEQTYEPAE